MKMGKPQLFLLVGQYLLFFYLRFGATNEFDAPGAFTAQFFSRYLVIQLPWSQRFFLIFLRSIWNYPYYYLAILAYGMFAFIVSTAHTQVDTKTETKVC